MRRLAPLLVLLTLLAACAAAEVESPSPRTPSLTPAPDDGVLGFEAASLDGRLVDARSLRGEALALWFWAPW